VNRTLRSLALLVAGGALLVAPTIGQAHHKPGHPGGPKGGPDKSQRAGPDKSQRCKKPATNVGFVVRGALTSFTADDPNTAANEARVSITVTGANRHARESGDLPDVDPSTPGTQVKGGAFTVSASADPFEVQLEDFEVGEAPAAGDSVTIIGKIARTKAKCAAPGTSVADRYGPVNIRKVVIHDAD
jgi:hypothetical protein